jgi:hypothetical protein
VFIHKQATILKILPQGWQNEESMENVLETLPCVYAQRVVPFKNRQKEWVCNKQPEQTDKK